MKLKILFTLFFIAVILFSCNKEEPCIDVTFEISGLSNSVDVVDFRLAGEGATYNTPDDSRIYNNVSIPYAETITLCKENFDYNLRCYVSDTSTILTLKVYANGVLKDKITSSTGEYNNFIELAGGIND